MARGCQSRVRLQRLARGWTQARLAELAGISRAEVSAIESGRLVPSVATALAIARALGTTVEQLFGDAQARCGSVQWAWEPHSWPARFWQACIGPTTFCYPVEPDAAGPAIHDGLLTDGSAMPPELSGAHRTLVVATCDPAARVLAEEYARQTGYRMLVLVRATEPALRLLRSGLVHAAGVHVATDRDPAANAVKVREVVGRPAWLVRVAVWQEGVVVVPGARCGSLRDLVKSRVRWVGREPGAAARSCLEELLGGKRLPRTVARSHRAVAEAVRSGWADAGVCVRVCGEDAGLRFFTLRRECYDLCFLDDFREDPRIVALMMVLRSHFFRQRLGELPGYDSSVAGELIACDVAGTASAAGANPAREGKK